MKSNIPEVHDLTVQNGGATLLAFNPNALHGTMDGYGTIHYPSRFVPSKKKYLTGNETPGQIGKPTKTGGKK